LAMKLLIADNVAPLADRIFALSNPTLMEAWLGAAAYSIQLLFDFAGYSAMAIGLGLMIGFTFVENFNQPYISQSITEFWRRWHISLSQWLRDYLYLPLGGNRKGKLRTYINLITTMVLGGLWHGANWTFLLWGAWHGLWLAIERMLGAKNTQSVWPKTLAWPFTMVLVMIGWVLFRAETVAQAVNVYTGMIGLNGIAISDAVAWQLQSSEQLFLFLGIVISVRGPWMLHLFRQAPEVLRYSAVASLMLAACLTLVAQNHSPFLYFQF